MQNMATGKNCRVNHLRGWMRVQICMCAALLLACLLAVPALADVPLDEAHFPDAVFRAYVADQFDRNSDGVLDPDEVQFIGTIDLRGAGIDNVTDLTGIEYFNGLTYLHCENNQLTRLNVSANDQLVSLYCYDNQLTRLDVSANTELKRLDCADNQLTSLDLSANTKLDDLFCGYNQLTRLDLSANTELEELEFSGNQLTRLDVSANRKLEFICCDHNQLRSLELSDNACLKVLECCYNQLDLLDLSGCPMLLQAYANGTHTSHNYSTPTERYEIVEDEHYLWVDSSVRIITSSQIMLQPDFVLPSAVTTIEESAFENMSAGVVYIPDTCTRIGKWAFRNCKNLKQIRIPANCSVGSEAFSGCPEVVIFGTTGSPAQTYAENHANCSFVAE